jgi:hypothetical protein
MLIFAVFAKNYQGSYYGNSIAIINHIFSLTDRSPTSDPIGQRGMNGA